MRTQQGKIYRAALYLRLSREDVKEGGGYSSSIETQRDITRSYAISHQYNIVGTYIDDGFSGTSFDRPDFNRMISDIEAGLVNCVITKDYSRLGRNYIECGMYLEQYFPKKGVRYIAINDGIDTEDPTSGGNMTAPFLSVAYEMYARDTSRKIRSSFQSKMERGEYIGNFAPYGYRKDPANKNHLLIDPAVAPMVKRIFMEAAEGKTPGQIAKELNAEGVATPAEYRCQSRPYLDVNRYTTRKAWTSSGICKMLKKRVYLGETEQGKTQKISFKSKETLRRSKEDWIRVPGTHEPIVSQEIFDAVQRRSAARREPRVKGFVNIFSGVAFCPDCGKALTATGTRKKNSPYKLCCSGYKYHGSRECSNHFIEYNVLYYVVQEELRKWLNLSPEDKEQIIAAAEQEARRAREAWDADELQKRLCTLKEEQARYDALIESLFEQFALQKLSQERYEKLLSRYEREQADIKASIRALEHSDSEESEIREAYGHWYALLDEVSEVERLNKVLVRKLIDRIEVDDATYRTNEAGKTVRTQTVRIYYKFIGCAEKRRDA